MNMKFKAAGFSACLIALGCSPLAPQPDHSKFFILTPINADVGAASVPGKASQPLTIGVGPIDFPDYLKHPEVVTLAAPNEIDLANERRWGEPLDKNFTRVLTENLSQLLDTQRIEKYPWPRKTQIDYQVEVDVQRFETSGNGQSQLVARWIIKDPQKSKDLYASRTTASSPVDKSDAGASAALSHDLATLSREVASQITELNQQRTSRVAAIDHVNAD